MICVWVGGCEKDCNISVCAYFAFVLCMNIVYTSHAGIFRRGCFDLQGGVGTPSMVTYNSRK